MLYPSPTGFWQLRPPLASRGGVAALRHSARYDSSPRLATKREERARKTKIPLARGILLAALLWLPLGTAHADAFVLKFATLAPEGSAWMNIIDAWSKQVEQESGGRLKFKLYPGGVAGDEPDVLRKIRFGQLHGAAITGHGIGLVYSPARVLEMPFLFETYDEIDYVREQLIPEFRPEFEKNGFQLLSWIEVGCVRLFSTEPIDSIEKMRKRRIWLWQGDTLAEAFFEVSELAPIPLSITEVFTSLSTGLIDTVSAPPLAAIAMQWFTKTPYVSDPAMANGIGGLVVANRFFRRLPEDLQRLLLRTGEQAGRELVEVTRRDNQKSLDVLKDKGVKLVRWSDAEAELVTQMRDDAAKRLDEQDYIPAAVFDRVMALVAGYQAGRTASTDASCFK